MRHQMLQRIYPRLGDARVRTGVLLAIIVTAVLAVAATSSAQLPGASVSVCQVTGSASVPNYAQVNVSVADVAAYLNQFPGSFVGTCPAAGPPAPGTSGAVTICHVTGNVATPFTEVSVAADQVAAYLNQNPGSFVGTCPASGGSGGGGGGGLPSAAVTICQVTGSVSAPSLVEVKVAVDQVAAFLNQNPGSFVGACPAGSGGSGGGSGLNGGLTICSLTGSVNAPSFAQVNVAVDQLAAYLNRNPGSFVGQCPSAGDPNGNPGAVPTGFVTICRVTGNAASPYATLTIAASQLGVYLTQAGTIVPAPADGCPTAVPGGPAGGGAGGGGGPPSSTTTGSTTTIVVQTTPNTVVTATGAGVNQSTKSDKNGKAVLKVKPKRAGIIKIKGAGGRTIKRVGVTSKQRSGAHLTG